MRLRLGAILLMLPLLALPACRLTDLHLWGPAPDSTASAVEHVRDVPYGPVAEGGRRHQLDLFLPKGRKDFPVVVLVHGGAWMMGDNRCSGLYSSVGEFLASQGIGAVLPNYRLSPGVKHPEHIKDLARAFAWTHANIGKFGGDASQLFLTGHSAGGHLVALLATDERWLKAEGHSTKEIRGVVAVSGVYHIPGEAEIYELGGSKPASFRLDQNLPLRRPGGTGPVALPGVPLKVNVFGPVFGDDPQVRAQASPVHHVRPGLPPFLLFSAEQDLPSLPRMAAEFDKALRDQGCACQLFQVEKRNHNSIMFMAIERNDPVAARILDFIRGK